MKKPPLSILVWAACLAAAAVLLLAISGCTPSLTREQLTPSPTPPGTPRPTRTLDPSQQVENFSTPDATREQDASATLLPAVSAIGPLLIEEFPLARADAADLLPGSTEQNAAFAESLPEDITSGHGQIAESSSPSELEEANAALAPLGYALEQAGDSLRLLRDGETVEECLLPDAFRTWDDRWVLELNSDVLLDGERLTEQRVFDEVFAWQVLAGSEFFLYRQNNQYGIYFDGRSLPQTYDQIVRWDCADQQDAGGFNFSAQSSDEAVGFFAQKSGRWYYVRVSPLE